MSTVYCRLPQGGNQRPEPGAALLIQPLPGIGDMVWHLPAICALARHSGAPIWVLTKRRSAAADLLRAEPAVAGLVWLDRNPGVHDGLIGLWRLASTLRQGRFASAWVLHGSGRYALASAFAGIPNRYGYGDAGMHWLTKASPLTAADRRLHPVEKAAVFLHRMGVDGGAAAPALKVSEIARARIATRLGPVRGNRLVLGVGSSDPRKQWGAERFGRLIANLSPKPFTQVVIVGGRAERELIDRLVARALPGTVIAALDWPLDDVAALLMSAAQYVGNDTGVLNMAAAVGCPVLGLFGHSPPLRYSPLIHAILPPQGRYGMEAISVEAVLAAMSHTTAVSRAVSEPG